MAPKAAAREKKPLRSREAKNAPFADYVRGRLEQEYLKYPVCTKEAKAALLSEFSAEEYTEPLTAKAISDWFRKRRAKDGISKVALDVGSNALAVVAVADSSAGEEDEGQGAETDLDVPLPRRSHYNTCGT